ncbi:hypothetical protein [Streptomyces sp. NPDC050538]|uniref:hypothetical protein n=1 Tax=Streptomyces sp. NPDC050538 TaxID=3365627 RepID=UPI00379F6608
MPWPEGGAPPTIDLIPEVGEPTFAILDVKGGYGENDFVNREPAEMNVTEFGNRIKNPVDQPPGRERTPHASKPSTADESRRSGTSAGSSDINPMEDGTSSVVTFDILLGNPPF